MANHLGTRRRVIRRTHQPPHQISVISSTGSGRNYVSTRRVYQTPSTTQVEDETQTRNLSLPSIGGGNISGPSGSAGTVVIVGVLLMMTVTWNDFWKPYFDTLMNGTQLQANIDGRLILGGFLFITIAAFIASTSPDAGGVMIMIMIAMWLVYITVGTGGKQLNTFFSWFQQTTIGTVTGGAGKTPTPTSPTGQHPTKPS